MAKKTEGAKRKVTRKKIRAAHWKKSSTMAVEKYESVSKAILKTLKTKGMRWGALVDQVQDQLPKFEGSVWHYVIRCLRELETQGKVRREMGPPVLYSRRKK